LYYYFILRDNHSSCRAHGESDDEEGGGGHVNKKQKHFKQTLVLGEDIFVLASKMIKPFECEEGRKWKYAPKPFLFSWFRVITHSITTSVLVFINLYFI
jgi:hypothetical protein